MCTQHLKITIQFTFVLLAKSVVPWASIRNPYEIWANNCSPGIEESFTILLPSLAVCLLGRIVCLEYHTHAHTHACTYTQMYTHTLSRTHVHMHVWTPVREYAWSIQPGPVQWNGFSDVARYMQLGCIYAVTTDNEFLCTRLYGNDNNTVTDGWLRLFRFVFLWFQLKKTWYVCKIHIDREIDRLKQRKKDRGKIR